MTERWRKKLEGIDGASPNDDVFERAKEGPMHREDPLPGPRMSTRVVTVVAAFAVFALAISVFAIPALRMGGEAGSEVTGLLPLWPAQTPDQLEQLQANPPAWALDPQQVAERFGQQVMGWPNAWATDVACDLPAVVSSSPSIGNSIVDETDHVIDCRPGWFSWGGPGPSFSSAYPVPSGASGPVLGGAFRNFSVFPDGLYDPSTTQPWLQQDQDSEFVQVYQPLEQGDGQIWAVLQAQSPRIQLSVAPGQNVRSGASVSAGYYTDETQTPTLAYASCGASGASSSFRAPIDPTRISLSVGKGIALDVSLPESEACSGPQPGYVWAATSSESLAAPDGTIASDPVQGAGPSLSGLTAAPATMIFPQVDAQTTAATSPTPNDASPAPEPVTYTTYTDPYGWTIDVPDGWQTNTIRQQGSGTQGAQFVGDSLSIQVSTDVGGVPTEFSDDSSFPLVADDLLSQAEGGLLGHFQADGLRFDVTVLSPSLPEWFADEHEIASRMISSISFEPWRVGQTRNGLTAVGEILPASSAEWVTFQGDHFIASNVDGHRTFFGGDGGVPTCGGGGGSYEVRETGVAGISCPDGTGGDWDISTGKPAQSNTLGFDVELASHPAMRSWDGQLLADLSGS